MRDFAAHWPKMSVQPITTDQHNETNPYESSLVVESVVGSTPTETGTKDSGLRAVLALADQVVVSGTNFVTMAMVARYCAQADVGLFHLAWTLVGFLRTAQERLLSAPYLVFVHQRDQKPKTLLGSSLTHQAIFAMACVFLLVVLSQFLSGMGFLMAALAASIPFILLRDHVRAICAAHFKYHVALTVDFVVCVVQIGGIWWLAHRGTLSIASVAVVLGIASLLPTIAWVLSKQQPFTFHRQSIAADWKQNWNYSFWLVAARTVGISGYFAVPWIVARYMNTAATGAFGIASGLVGLSLMFVMGANNFFQPRTVKAYHDHGVDSMFRTVLEAMAVFGTVLSLVVVFFSFAGGRLLGLIYGPTYASYGPVVVALSVSTLTVSISIACGNGLAALGKPKGYFWGELAYCVVSITAAFILIPIMGLNGAGLALAAGGVATSAVTVYTLMQLVQLERQANWAATG